MLLGQEWDLFRDGNLELHRQSLLNLDETWASLGRHDADLEPACRTLPHGTRAMLIEKFVPVPDAIETHRIEIDAPASVVYAALWTTDLGSSPVIRALTALRGLPKQLFGKPREREAGTSFNLDSLIRAGFGKLAEDSGCEIVLGVSGRFWRPVDNLLPFRREDFNGPVLAGAARAVWNFHVTPASGGRTLLSTETRVVCGDAASRRKFRAYWLLVRPFSGWIRIVMLHAVARECSRRNAGR